MARVKNEVGRIVTIADAKVPGFLKRYKKAELVADAPTPRNEPAPPGTLPLTGQAAEIAALAANHTYEQLVAIARTLGEDPPTSRVAKAHLAALIVEKRGG